MSLDLTYPGRYNPGVHYRRYLTDDGRIVVICVQDFDYVDYHTAKFVDSATFETEAEADAAPIDVGPLLTIVETEPGTVTAAQAMRIIRATLRHNGVVA